MIRSVYKKGDIEELIPLAQNGDVRALEEIIKKVQKNIYTIFLHQSFIYGF